MPGLWGASLLFFSVNSWILGIIISDIGTRVNLATEEAEKQGGDKRSRHRSRPLMRVEGGSKKTEEEQLNEAGDNRSKHRSRPLMIVPDASSDAN